MKLGSVPTGCRRPWPHSTLAHRCDTEWACAKPESVLYETVNCSLAITRPAAGVVLLKFTGPDVGEFGEAPFQELARDLEAHSRITLFVDAGDCSGATIDVSGEWARWMSANRERLTGLHLLCGSRFIQLTAGFVRRFTGFEERMCIYTERSPFEEALAAASGRRA